MKVVPADRLDEPARLRLRADALTLSQLSHPNIASVFEFGSHADVDYLVMEYVPGTTVNALVQRGPLESPAVARVGAQLARGLAAAHERGIVHRDIKPGNVRVTPDGLLKILDFGMATSALPAPKAKTTTGFFDRTPALAGTIQYMAPERLRGNPADARADIFSAGALIYELACGRPPFCDPQPIRLIESILSSRPDEAVRDQPDGRFNAGDDRPAGARSGSGGALRQGGGHGRCARRGGEGAHVVARLSVVSVARPATSLSGRLDQAGRSAGGVGRGLQTPPCIQASRLVHADDHPIERVEQVLTVRVRPGRVGARRDAGLRELADVPVLPVRHVPELDRIRRVEPRPRQLRRDGSATRRC